MDPKYCLKLKSGYSMPMVGLGTWQSTDQEVELAVNSALENGYKLIDTAWIYGNEGAIGRVLKKWFDSGKLRREDIFITTKLPINGMTPELVPKFCQKSLQNLGLSYIDLYLIHNPVGIKYSEDKTPITKNADGTIAYDMTTNLEELWQAMEKLVQGGLVRSIGVSNYNRVQIERTLKIAKVPISNLQVELHAYYQQKPLRELCDKNGIVVTSYASLGSPGRSDSSISNQEVKNLMEDSLILTLAKKYSKSPAQILLKFLMQLNIAVIPKSVNPQRVKQNLDLFDFQLSGDEVKQLEGLDKGVKGRSFDFSVLFPGYGTHPESPYDIY